MKILVGTAKGLIVYHCEENTHLQFSAVHFTGFSVNMVYIDERNGRWWAGVSHKHWGQKLHYSDSEGKTWDETMVPSYKGINFPNGKPAKLRQIWCMVHGGYDKPDELWLGTDPGGLFHTKDGGKSFQLVESLWSHPSRKDPMKWFGAGSDFPFIHSIQVNPKNSNHIYIGVSCAGIFESKDGGASWNPKNKGLIAAYLPNPNVEIGHDPHHVRLHPSNPDVIWQQNHCGVFVTQDGGENWNDVSVHDGLPDYGFSLAIDEKDPAKAWVIPVESDEQRIAPGLSLNVYFTEDFGKTWVPESDGLPQENVFDIVLRQAFNRKGEVMIFGTTNGNLYYKLCTKTYWNVVTSNLTKINAVFIY